MKPLLLGAVGALALGAVAFSGSAQAACLWNGYNWVCDQAPAYTQYAPTYQYPAYQAYPAYNYNQTYSSGPYWTDPYAGPRPSGH
jgi:hypothetical protein